MTNRCFHNSWNVLRIAAACGSALALLAVTGCGGSDDAGLDKKKVDAGPDAPSGTCAAGQFRCTGDLLETCATDLSGFQPVATCQAGLCDAAGKQCDNCKAGEGACDASGSSYTACDSTGQKQENVACQSPTPFCIAKAGAPTCVACKVAADCPPSTSECQLAACSTDYACGLSPVSKGAPCGKQGEGGTCDGAGSCVYCAPGEKRCSGLVPETCSASGQWVASPACSGSDPICLDGGCVECASASDCPTSSNECLSASCTAGKCGYAPDAQGTTCSGGSGTCNGAGQCNLCQPGNKICNGNVPLVCGSNGQYASQPACSGSTPNCDPASGVCVQCSTASQCPAGSGECLTPTCSSKICGYAPVAQGTPCAGGTCNGAGQCWACTPGTAKCSGDSVLTCNAQGQYDPATACTGATPHCEPTAATCVQCTASSQCSQPANQCLQATCTGNACVTGNVANGTACASGGDNGTCQSGSCKVCTSGATRCKLGTTGTVQTCDANGQWQDTLCPGGQLCWNGACQSGPVCGNGVVETGEQCDDANGTKCDGCESCEKRNWLNVPANAYVSIPGLTAKLPTNSESACYEAWVKTAPGLVNPLYLGTCKQNNVCNFTLQYRGDIPKLRFAIQNGGAALLADANVNPQDNAWHHLAGCRAVAGANLTLTLFWDGALVATANGTTAQIGTPSTVYVGGLDYVQPGIGGSIDEIRVSNTLRYTGAFTPARRHSVDANTSALFHLDEGVGNTTADVSANQLVASLVGTSWSVDTGYTNSMCQ